ncbi:hypothetical protein GEMRC1_013489 [Eukaryota sp. GEM-RC1]
MLKRAFNITPTTVFDSSIKDYEQTELFNNLTTYFNISNWFVYNLDLERPSGFYKGKYHMSVFNDVFGNTNFGIAIKNYINSVKRRLATQSGRKKIHFSKEVDKDENHHLQDILYLEEQTRELIRLADEKAKALKSKTRGKEGRK